MVSNTPSRSGLGASASASSKSRSAKPTSTRKRGTAKSGAKKAAPKHEISPAVRKQWDKLTQRWQNLLPKLTPGNGGAKRRSRSKSKAA